MKNLVYVFKNNFVTCMATLTVVLVSVTFFIAPHTIAQVNVDACQKEYNERRAQCISDNEACTGTCSGDQNCELTCSNQRNACDDAAVARQKECLGLNDGEQDCQREADGDSAVCQKTIFECLDTCQPILDATRYDCEDKCRTNGTACYKARNDKYSACVTGVPAQAESPEQPAERPIEQAPQTIVEGTNDIDSLLITLPGGFDPIFVTFLDKMTDNNPEIFLNEQPDEQQKMIDDFIKSEKLTAIVIGTVDGKSIEVDLRDVPLADIAKEPLEAVARQDIKGILAGSPSLWFNSEGALIRGTLLPDGKEEERLLNKKQFSIQASLPSPQLSSQWDFRLIPTWQREEEHQKKWEKMLSRKVAEYDVPLAKTADGLSVSVILLGENAPPPFSETTPNNESKEDQQIVSWENVKFVTQPGARQIGILNDTPFVLHPDSQVGIKSLNTLELSGGAVEIQRPDNPLDPSVTVETPLGSVISDKTRFWVAHNPARGYTLVGVWEGAVSVAHAYTGETIKLEALENGMPNIALLLSPEFGKSKIGAWPWILLVAIAGGLSYFAYRKKDMLMKLFKKQPMP